jgi:hypothetical protein
LGRPTAAEAYDRQWALTSFSNALAGLKEEFEVSGKSTQYELLKPFLSIEASERAYLQPARKLGISEGAVAVMVHRLRGRYRELVRQEIAQTVSKPEECDAEVSYLISLILN